MNWIISAVLGPLWSAVAGFALRMVQDYQQRRLGRLEASYEATKASLERIAKANAARMQAERDRYVPPPLGVPGNGTKPVERDPDERTDA